MLLSAQNAVSRQLSWVSSSLGFGSGSVATRGNNNTSTNNNNVNIDSGDSGSNTKNVVLSVIGGCAVVCVTFGILFYKDVQKHRNAQAPLGYMPIINSEYPNNIKDRSTKDIVKDRFTPGKTIIPQNIDYIVIGSGIGGLSTAALLSRVGRKCLVLEQHDRLGGCMHQYSRAFGFDVGIHYIGAPKKYQRMLNCMVDKDSSQYPIKFVKLGTKEDGFTYDRYVIGDLIFDAKPKQQLSDLRKLCQNNPKQLEAIDKLESKMKGAITLLTLLMLVKLLENIFLSKVIFSILKWKFSDIWDKTITQVLNDVGADAFVSSIVFANLGDLGKTQASNSFVLFCAVFYHYQKEGGYYIEGGPQQITRGIMPTIEKSGGRCMANSKVIKILFDENKRRAIGVTVERNGKTFDFYAKKGIISAIGFKNTFNKLVSLPMIKFENVEIKNYQNIIESNLISLSDSPQHFQCFVGLNKNSKELNLPSHNIWTMQGINDECKSYDEAISKYHNDPLTAPVFGFVGFPSAKDPSYSKMYGENKAVCVIVTEIPRKHFEKFENEPCGARSKEYEKLKNEIGQRLVEELLFKPFPQTRDCVDKIKFGTALTSEHYLGSFIGESYGLHNDTKRYFDFDTLKYALNFQTGIKGLYLSGQDCLSAGFAGAIESGMLCAQTILGYNTLSCLLSKRSIVKDIEKLDKTE